MEVVSKDNKQGNKKDKGKGKFRGGDLPAWVYVHPKEGEKQSKTVDGKDYHWCPNHSRWTRHKPSDCKGIGFKGELPRRIKATRVKTPSPT